MSSSNAGGTPAHDTATDVDGVRFVVQDLSVGEARSAVLQAGGAIAAGYFTLVGLLGLLLAVTGDVAFGATLVTLAVVILGQVLVRAPRHLSRSLAAPATWTVTGDQVRVEAPDSLTSVGWSRVARVATTRDFLMVRFRNGLTLVAPARCTQPGQLVAVRQMARDAGVRVRGNRR